MSSGRTVSPPPTVAWSRHYAGPNKIRCPHCKEYAILTQVDGKPRYHCKKCHRGYSTPTKRSS